MLERNKIFFCSTTGGCTTNLHLSSQIVNFLHENKIRIVKTPKKADYIIINTCGLAEDKANLTIEYFLKRYKDTDKKIILCGCLSKMTSRYNKNPKIMILNDVEEFNKLIVNPKKRIENLVINKFVEGLYTKNKNSFLPYNFNEDEYPIKICSGCLGKCSFCSIKFVIGRLRSRPVKDILSEFKNGLSEGYKKFFLFGDDCGCYGFDIGTNLIELLEIMFGINKDCLFRLHYIEPVWLIKFYPEFKKLLYKNKKRIMSVCVPVQSGSNRILKLMNRNYKIKKILDILKDIKRNIPRIKLSTFVIYGFPTETDYDFQKSLKILRYFDAVIPLPYSEQPGTESVKIFPKVSYKKIVERYKILKKIKNTKGYYFKTGNLTGPDGLDLSCLQLYTPKKS